MIRQPGRYVAVPSWFDAEDGELMTFVLCNWRRVVAAADVATLQRQAARLSPERKQKQAPQDPNRQTGSGPPSRQICRFGYFIEAACILLQKVSNFRTAY